jgi:hypothetical protein
LLNKMTAMLRTAAVPRAARQCASGRRKVHAASAQLARTAGARLMAIHSTT